MATLNDSTYKVAMPDWARFEIRDDHVNMHRSADLAVRARDGWVHLIHIPLDMWMSEGTLYATRRTLLEELKKNVTLELAKLTLEET